MARGDPNIRITSSVSGEDWRVSAACRDSDPDLFFPIGNTGPAIEQIASAKAICETCDVQIDCLNFAIETNQDSGVWGGTDEEERRKLRKAWLSRARKSR